MRSEHIVVHNDAVLEVDFITASIKVGGGHDGQLIIHGDGLGVQEAVSVFPQFHASGEQSSVIGTARQCDQFAVVGAGDNQGDA